MPDLTPTDCHLLDGNREILISWNDGSRSLISGFELRWNCPCAQCIDEHTGKKLLTRKEQFSQIMINQFDAVGRYALRFLFSDGHHTGIYSYPYLRQILDQP